MKKICPKKNWAEKKNLFEKKILLKKKFGQKKIVAEKKKLGRKKIGPKKYWAEKNIGRHTHRATPPYMLRFLKK